MLLWRKLTERQLLPSAYTNLLSRVAIIYRAVLELSPSGIVLSILALPGTASLLELLVELLSWLELCSLVSSRRASSTAVNASVNFLQEERPISPTNLLWLTQFTNATLGNKSQGLQLHFFCYLIHRYYMAQKQHPQVIHLLEVSRK